MDDRRFCRNAVSNQEKSFWLTLGMIPGMTRATRTSMFAIVLVGAFLSVHATAFAGDAHWIWSPKDTTSVSGKSQGVCYFRKKFTLLRPEKAELEVAAGDEYAIYLNGRLAAQGRSNAATEKFDVKDFMEPGVNLVAVKVQHNDGKQVGLAVRLRVKEVGEPRWRILKSDESWKTRINSIEGWKVATYNDLGWLRAQTRGPAFVVSKKVASSQGLPQAQKAQSIPTATSSSKQTERTVSAAVPASRQEWSDIGLMESPAKSDVKDVAMASQQTEQAAPNPTSPVPNNNDFSPIYSPAADSVPTNEAATQFAAQSPQSDVVQAEPSATDDSAFVGNFDQVESSAADQNQFLADAFDIGPTDQAAVQQTQQQTDQQAFQPAEQPASRFEIDSEFTVEAVLSDEETGSLIAMEFDEFGKLLLSREEGPLLIADPTKPLEDPQRIRVYCEEVSTCQGILPLNGFVYVTADGPKGLGLYKLADRNRDGLLEIQSMLLGFTGESGEHGPHGVQLGPDGMIYVIVGSGSQVKQITDATGPYQDSYEGDLIPRYEDPGGHAVGVKAPGGTIVRVSVDGKKVEMVAGGIRNAYDFAFDHNGELFFHDSDMESDIGTTWYRQTKVFHVPDGAEFGWRSGSAKFADYFIDQTPSICDTGRGSPTGAVLYQHLQFPLRYQDTIFLADWSEGRILALRQQKNESGYIAETETFLKGRPLNVCDLAIGEDGAMYFCTGGRGTAGGVYRISWNGEIPEQMLKFDTDLAKAVRHPQPNSAWARQNISRLKIQMGKEWGPSIMGAATEARNSEKLRLRAMQLMTLYGPVPTEEFLIDLSQDENPAIRTQVARMCGLKTTADAEHLLRQLSNDLDPQVRRSAFESYIRLGIDPPLKTILRMLSSLDRVEAMTARRLIERIPVREWEEEVFTTGDKRLFIQGSLAMMTAYPDLARSYRVLAKSSKFMEGFINDQDFVDMLRTMQLALVQGQVNPAKVPGLAERISNEFPSGNSRINRELVRAMAYLRVGDLDGRMRTYLTDPDVSTEDKVHLCLYMQTVRDRLAPGVRLAIIDSLEEASVEPDFGGSYKIHLRTAVKQLSGSIGHGDLNNVFENGERWPTAVVAAFYKLPHQPDAETLQLIMEMDQRMKGSGQDPAIAQVRLGVIAVLAQSGDKESMSYLRKIWQEEESRRTDISIGLAQQPDGANWAYLVSSIPVLDDLTGIEVLDKLTTVSRRPQEAQHYHDVISLGYRLRAEGSAPVIRLLEHWSGEKTQIKTNQWLTRLNSWRTWYEEEFPDGEPISLATSENPIGRYSVNGLLASIQTSEGGDPVRGHEIFNKAQCASCHRVGVHGESVGPDLTNLAQRFSLREAVESTVDPSKVVPARYASKTIVTVDGDQITGMAVEQANGSYSILQSDGRQIRVNANEISQIRESRVSAMPHGLLDNFSEVEINDLFAFMMQQPAASVADSRTNTSDARLGSGDLLIR